MADMFEQAVAASFDQTPAGAEMRRQAEQWLAQIMASPEHDWRFFLQRFDSSPTPQVKFWCIHALTERLATMGVDERPPFQQALVEWLAGPCIQRPMAEVYLRNKFAALYVAMIRLDYPTRWPSAFTELITRLQLGVPMVDMLLRVLDCVDTEFVSTDIDRSREEAERGMEVKDAMRQDCISQIVDVWHQLLQGYHTKQLDQPALVNDCLQLIEKYIVWVDISYIFHERFVSLFYAFFGDEVVRTSAAACIHALLHKGMDHSQKCSLIQTLQLPQIIGRLGKLEREVDIDFAIEIGRVLNGATSALMESSSPEAWELVGGLMPFTLQYLAHDDDDVSTQLLQGVNLILDNLRQSTTPQSLQGQEVLMLKALATKAQYAPDYNFEAEEEFEKEWQDYRKMLMKTFSKVVRYSPERAAQFVMDSVETAIQHWNTMPFAQVELALHLLYVIGDPPQQPLPRWLVGAVVALIKSNVSKHPHKSVALVYHDLIERYMQVGVECPEHIPAIITAFLDERGLRHKTPQVRGRSAYLLKRVVKRMRGVPMLMQHAGALIQHMGQLCADGTVCHQDRLQVLEVMGVLICSEAFPEPQQAEQLAAVVAPMVHQIERLQQDPQLANDLYTQQQLGCAIEAIGSCFKSCPRKSPATERIFGDVLQLLAPSLQHWPPVPDLLTKALFFLHRAVENGGSERVIPSLGALLPGLLQRASTKDEIMKVMLLVNQIAMRYGAGVFEILNQLFMRIINQIQLVMGAVSPSASPGELASDEQRDAAELQKAYIDLVQCLVANQLSDVLVSDLNKGCFENILHSIMECSCMGSVDAQKSSLATLRLLIERWGGTQLFDPIVRTQIIPVAYRSILSPVRKLNAGELHILVIAVAGLQFECNKKLGTAAVAQLLGEVLPQLGVPGHVAVAFAQQVAVLVAEAEVRVCVKQFVTQIKS